MQKNKSHFKYHFSICLTRKDEVPPLVWTVAKQQGQLDNCPGLGSCLPFMNVHRGGRMRFLFMKVTGNCPAASTSVCSLM